MLNEQWDAKADPEVRGWQKCLQTSHDVMGYSESPFFWIVSCIWDLLSQQVVSLCHKGSDPILILLKLLTTLDLETLQNRTFLKTLWLISTISHITSLTSTFPDVSYFMNFSFFFFCPVFGITLCAKQLSVLNSMFLSSFVFFLFIPLKFSVLMKISSWSGSLLLTEFRTTKQNT